MARPLRASVAAGGALVLMAGVALGQAAPGPMDLDAPAPAAAMKAPVAPVPPLPVVIVPSLDAAAPSAEALPPPSPAAADPVEPPDPLRSKMERNSGLKVGPGMADSVAVLPKVEVPTPQAPFTLLHPQAVDSATLSADGRTVTLDGITALPDPSGGLQRFLRAQGDQVTCDPQGASYACAMPDGTDVALVSLANGAARATADAPESYRQQEAAAQAARRGIWASLPPPPVTVPHPAARTSALLVGGTDLYPLDGLQGFPGRPAQELEGYVASHGDSVTCQQQPGVQAYICTLPDGTDVAKVALVNGAARLAPGAPDAYREQQADAVANRRGIWATSAPPLPVVTRPPPVAALPGVPVYPGPVYPGPVPDGPVAYLGDQPTAVIEGEQAFFVFGGAGLGWGYWDHGRHWHGAPDRFARALERSHPDGRLGGHGGFGGPEHGGFANEGFRPGGVGRVGFVPGAGVGVVRGGFAPGGGHVSPAYAQPGPGFARPDFVRPNFARPEFARPEFARPGFAQPGFARPEFGRPAFARPGFAPAGFARPGPAFGHPGPAAFMGRPAMPVAIPRPVAPPVRSFPSAGGGHHR